MKNIRRKKPVIIAAILLLVLLFEDGIIQSRYAIEIGGVEIGNIYRAIDSVFPAENDIGRYTF